MASAFYDAPGMRNPALQVFAARWADDVHGRLQRTEAELRETRRLLDEARDRVARLDERLKNTEREHRAQDRLKFLGGAVLGAGVPLIIAGQYLLGAVCAAVGIALAYGIEWLQSGK